MTPGRRSSRILRQTTPARRGNDRQIISGIIQVLKSGCRWKDCPPEYDLPTTIYGKLNCWLLIVIRDKEATRPFQAGNHPSGRSALTRRTTNSDG